MYCPWSDIGERMPGVHVALRDISPARAAWLPSHSVVLLDRSLTRREGRSTLAHEIAHIDLGHVPTGLARFDVRQEREADRLAARRLITPAALADALVWSNDDHELAIELHVDVTTVRLRRELLTLDEVAAIGLRINALEIAA